jgi:hypothetical protein
MGTCSSKKLHLSVDVTGNNNYALVINGVQVNLTSVLHDIINQTNSENRTLMIVFCLSCIFLMLLLGIIVMSVLLPMKHRSRQSYIIMTNIEDDIGYLKRKIEKLASQTEHFSMLLLQKKTNWQPENIYVDEYPQSSA